jgi:hypothetical protein
MYNLSIYMIMVSFEFLAGRASGRLDRAGFAIDIRLKSIGARKNVAECISKCGNPIAGD